MTRTSMSDTTQSAFIHEPNKGYHS
jgi:hypothetical protein